MVTKLAQVYGGRWEVVRPLAEGGQAHTFLVKDKATGLLAVLKRLKNVKRLDRFRTEVEVLKSLKHPGIVELFADDLESSKPYFVMEYCEGRSLLDAPKPWRSAPILALEFVAEVADAVGTAHAAGITHRDLKPANILLRRPWGPPVVADFGICYVEDDERKTLVDEAVGPRLYMAPELEDGRADEVGPGSDVYSLGKVLYWLLHGERALSREQHRAARWDLVNFKKDGTMEHVNRLLDRMIVADPSRRLQNGKQVASAIREVVRLIKGGYNVVSGKIPQPCRYCGQGQYQRAPSNSTNDISNFGLNPVGAPSWLFLVCDYCGHVELFRREHAKAASLWDP